MSYETMQWVTFGEIALVVCVGAIRLGWWMGKATRLASEARELAKAPPVKPQPPEIPLRRGYKEIAGYPGLCVHRWGKVVFRENIANEATFWHDRRYGELIQEGISDAAIADALRYMVTVAVERYPSLNLHVIDKPTTE